MEHIKRSSLDVDEVLLQTKELSQMLLTLFHLTVAGRLKAHFVFSYHFIV